MCYVETKSCLSGHLWVWAREWYKGNTFLPNHHFLGTWMQILTKQFLEAIYLMFFSCHTFHLLIDWLIVCVHISICFLVVPITLLCRTEDNLWNSLVFFHPEGPRDETKVHTLGSIHWITSLALDAFSWLKKMTLTRRISHPEAADGRGFVRWPSVISQ